MRWWQADHARRHAVGAKFQRGRCGTGSGQLRHALATARATGLDRNVAKNASTRFWRQSVRPFRSVPANLLARQAAQLSGRGQCATNCLSLASPDRPMFGFLTKPPTLPSLSQLAHPSGRSKWPIQMANGSRTCSFEVMVNNARIDRCARTSSSSRMLCHGEELSCHGPG